MLVNATHRCGTVLLYLRDMKGRRLPTRARDTTRWRNPQPCRTRRPSQERRRVCVSALTIYDLRIDPEHEIEDINQRSAAFCARGWPLLTQIGSFSRVAFAYVARGKSSEVEAPRSEAWQGRAGQGESAGFSKGGFRERSIVSFDISSRSFHRGKRTRVVAHVVAQNKKKEKKERKRLWKMRIPMSYRTQIHSSLSCK